MTRPAHDERPEPLVEIAGVVRDLTTSQFNAVRFVLQDERGRPVKNDRHITKHPSLLDQLRAAGIAGRGGDGVTGGYESRPAARLAALDVLHRIGLDVDDWIVRRLATDVRATLEDNLRLLVGLAATVDSSIRGKLAADARGWLTRARVVTGWDSEPWRPNAGCPACEHVGGLRVRLEERIAACLQCQESWTPDTIGILAEHLRELNADARSRRQQRAELGAELDGYFPFRGPCLSCVHPSARGMSREETAEHTRRHDARHRVIEAVVAEVLAGTSPDCVGEMFDLPAEAVLVAVAVATWPADDSVAESLSA